MMQEMYRKCKLRYVGVSVVDIVDNRNGSFTRPTSTSVLETVPGKVQVYAVPFFEFMRSEISRSRARFGSKFCGSTAFSGQERQFPQPKGPRMFRTDIRM